MSKRANGVAEVASLLSQHLKLMPDHHLLPLPEMAFYHNQVVRADYANANMPRDFLLRTLGGEVAVKVHYVPGRTSGAFYRALAYQISSDGRYLQIMYPKTTAECEQAMPWLAHWQSPIQIMQPTGIRSLDELLHTIQTAKERAA